MAVSAFCFSQAKFRRATLILCFLLSITYIYVAIFGRMEIDSDTIVGFKKGVRERFLRSGVSKSEAPSWDSKHGGEKNSFKSPRRIDITPDDSAAVDTLTDADFSEESFSKGQELTRQMMKHAWDGYRKFAWGEDELFPIARAAGGMLGPHSMLVTIIDALDTLMIMRMDGEYLEARDLVFSHLNFDKPMKVSMFEMNIRVLGGLLGAFALSGDGRYVTKAFDLAQRFMFNFNDINPFPANDLDLMGHTSIVDGTMNVALQETPKSLAQIGTFSLEFGYLSDILSDKTYVTRATAIIEKLAEMKTSLEGLYPATIYPTMITQPDDYFTFGGQGDSFYEYLLKYWIYTGKRDKIHYKMYKQSIAGMRRHLLQRRNGHIFVANRRGNSILEEQDHLACFTPGMLALGAHEENDKETLELAEQMAETCYLMYHKQRLGLSPEAVNINTFKPILHRTYWNQRPEVIESLFVLWRITKNPKYRRWGYEIAQSIERHAKIDTGGYAGIENILANPVKYNDRQESYFLAETLKYLYLLFSSDDVLPLDKWVFNTEAHPFPINWRGITYSDAEKAGSKAPMKEAMGNHDTVHKLGEDEPLKFSDPLAPKPSANEKGKESNSQLPREKELNNRPPGTKELNGQLPMEKELSGQLPMEKELEALEAPLDAALIRDGSFAGPDKQISE